MSQTTKVLLVILGVLLVSVAGLWIYGNKKTAYETDLTIDAPASFVLDFLTDSQQYPRWMSQVQEVTSISQEKEVLGSIDKVIVEENGKPIGFENEVIRYIDSADTEDAKVLSIRSSNATVSNTMVFRLNEDKAGKTRLKYRYIVANVGLGRLLNFFIGAGDRTDMIAADARQFKKLVETDYQAVLEDEPSGGGEGNNTAPLENDQSAEPPSAEQN